ncbi:MAG: ATPase-activating ribosome biosynthesis protein [Cirrosporium novae-zelandiae]|nr:MAG: ATPase-activating ribosome biosynthesis protein [Cirrosporium novae-zelandiae]
MSQELQDAKLGWTKAYRAAHGKEMTVDTTLTFAARRNVPTRYNRDLVATTIKAMGRVSEIRARRERVFYKKRMAGKKARVLEEDRKLVKEQGHLLPPELQEKKNSMELEESTIMDMEDTMEETTKVEGQKRERKTRRKMLVGGGVVDEEMDLD